MLQVRTWEKSLPVIVVQKEPVGKLVTDEPRRGWNWLRIVSRGRFAIIGVLLGHGFASPGD